MIDAILSLAVMTAAALVGGGIILWRRGLRAKAGLMWLLAVVMAGNVVLWSAPVTGGATLAQAARS
ncbi:hypothetical protein GTZ99_03895 [Novosphingobium sp. FSY-8]|uniref:Uncharacterized protein n=1 Tax=Novosphingobium ovatum TaxID=1908523 RepID=A0ABW9XAZ2_9SPHN|nr:hypothetical protein [Novosphingobium ovatum]NBC35695.1 hypothetical protein [Novosphingobium ovatum]